MRTLHIDTERGWRGGEQQALYLCGGLLQHGHEAVMACRSGDEMARRAARTGVPTYEFNPVGEIDPGAVLRLARLIRTGRFDLVHMHTSHAHTLGTLAGMLSPETALIVSRRVDFSVRKHAGSILKYKLPVDRYIAISEAVRDVLVKDGISADRISVVHSGIDLSRFEHVEDRDLRGEFGLPEDAVVIGNLGALVDHKGHRYLLDAAPEVLDEHPEARFIICGEGELRGPLEEQRRRLGLEGHVLLPGFRPDVPELLNFFDIYAVPSHMEGLNTSLLDALAMRNPVAACAAGGIPEIVRDGETGLLVPPRDPERLADAIIELIEHPEQGREMGQAGRQLVEREFCVESMVAGTLEVYRRVLAE